MKVEETADLPISNDFEQIADFLPLGRAGTLLELGYGPAVSLATLPTDFLSCKSLRLKWI